MSSAAHSHSQAAWQRLGLALVASALVHGALLANATFSVSPFGSAWRKPGAPLIARLVPEKREQAELPKPLPVPPPPAAPRKPQHSEEETASAVSGASTGGLPGEVFYRASELDERAVPLNLPDVEYPENALKSGTSGVVLLELRIDHTGALADVKVLSSRPSGIFTQAALKAVHALRFSPAMRKGVAVGSIKTIEIPFEPNCNLTGSCPNAGPN
jgi:TonB family protein